MTDPKRELEEIFRKHNFAYANRDSWKEGIQKAIMAWHLKHSRPKVKRLKIEEKLLPLQNHQYHCELSCKSDNCFICMKVLDNLIDLLNDEEEKVWCEHMENPIWMKQNSWTFCPYCGTKKPDET